MCWLQFYKLQYRFITYNLSNTHMTAQKRLTTNDLEVLRQLLLKGYTSIEAATEMGVSVATVSNYRAHFKKKGDTFPNNRGRKPKNSSKTRETVTNSSRSFSDAYKYSINGLIVTFSDRPKSLRIGKKGMVVEY